MLTGGQKRTPSAQNRFPECHPSRPLRADEEVGRICEAHVRRAAQERVARTRRESLEWPSEQTSRASNNRSIKTIMSLKFKYKLSASAILALETRNSYRLLEDKDCLVFMFTLRVHYHFFYCTLWIKAKAMAVRVCFKDTVWSDGLFTSSFPSLSLSLSLCSGLTC